METENDPMAGAPPSRIITHAEATETHKCKRTKRIIVDTDGLDEPGWAYRNWTREDGSVTRYVCGRAEPALHQQAAE